MRALVTVAIVWSLLASLAPDVFAEPQKSHPRTHAPYASPHVGPMPGYRTDGWYEHDANKLPIGSEIWWDQMGREGRARR
jgi:hypothetical protein